MRTFVGYHRGFWTLMLAAIFAAVCLIHIESSRAKQTDLVDSSKITVERLPSSEARTLGVDSRNN